MMKEKKMQKEELLKEFYAQDEIGKEMILEKLVFCHFSERFHSRLARLN